MRDKERGDGVTDGPLMRVKVMIDRIEVCITSNLINNEYVTNIYQLWGDAHATVRKYMGWCVPSPVPSIDIDYEYAKRINVRAIFCHKFECQMVTAQKLFLQMYG